MKIESSGISLASTSSFLSIRSKNEYLQKWVGSNPQMNLNDGSNQPPMSGLRLDILELSEQAKKMMSSSTSTASTEAADTENTFSIELSPKDKQKIEALQIMLEALTGKKINFRVLDKIKLDKPVEEYCRPSLTVNSNSAPVQQRQGWGLVYEYHEMNMEQQKMSFSAEGKVKTGDGREINFSLELSMSREFVSHTDLSIRAGDALLKDPLVINFAGNTASLTGQKYSFDLDADGTQDQISFVDNGSGFLALDLNSDGLINNGLELFGPQNGNGFAELAKYDGDSNGWIDENDAIFDKLRIWTKDENGKDQLFALGQKGVGAIYLGNISTVFDIKDDRNELQGAIRSTGVFLRENGTAGTVQHIDLAL